MLQEVTSLEDGTHVEVQVFSGASHWTLLQNYFTGTQVTVSCPNHRHYNVFTGRDVDAVREEMAREHKAWCGVDRYVGTNPTTCIVSIPTFGPTAVAVRIPKRHVHHSSTQHTVCTMDRIVQFSTQKFLATVLGVFLFHSAPRLSTSTPFRLAGGSLCFASLSLILLLYLVYRSVPYKRSVAVASFLFGSSVAAAVRYVFGVWIPSLGQLARNPLFLGYFIISWLVGLALTYYYNDTSDYKMNTLLKVALQLLGLGLVTVSAPSYHGLSLAVVSLLVSHLYDKLLNPLAWIFRRHSKKIDSLQTDEVVRQQEFEQRGGEEDTPETPPPRRKSQEGVGNTDQDISPLVKMGMVLNVSTGRTIKIGHATYNSLVLKGYEVDKVAGTITPPLAKSKST